MCNCDQWIQFVKTTHYHQQNEDEDETQGSETPSQAEATPSQAEVALAAFWFHRYDKTDVFRHYQGCKQLVFLLSMWLFAISMI